MDKCNRVPMGGRRVGPTLGDPYYEVAVNGGLHLSLAAFDVDRWVARTHFLAVAMSRRPAPAVSQ